MPTKSVSRHILYEQVWTTPRRKLAARYGVSDAVLAKTCRLHEIPLPGVGHWIRVARGRTPDRPPLPPATAEALEIVTVGPRATAGPLINFHNGRVARVNLRQDGYRHPLVIQSSKLLAKAPQVRWHYQVPRVNPPAGALDVWAVRDSVPAALALCDALFIALEQVGGQIAVGPPASTLDNTATTITIDGESFDFCVAERTPGTLSVGSPDLWTAFHVAFDLPKAEIKLATFANTLFALIPEKLARRLKEEEVAIRQQQAEDQRVAQAAVITEQRAMQRDLRADLARFQRARNLRDFVNAVNLTRAGEPHVAAWSDWALRTADELDPVQHRPRSLRYFTRERESDGVA